MLSTTPSQASMACLGEQNHDWRANLVMGTSLTGRDGGRWLTGRDGGRWMHLQVTAVDVFSPPSLRRWKKQGKPTKTQEGLGSGLSNLKLNNYEGT